MAAFVVIPHLIVLTKLIFKTLPDRERKANDDLSLTAKAPTTHTFNLLL